MPKGLTRSEAGRSPGGVEGIQFALRCYDHWTFVSWVLGSLSTLTVVVCIAVNYDGRVHVAIPIAFAVFFGAPTLMGFYFALANLLNRRNIVLGETAIEAWTTPLTFLEPPLQIPLEDVKRVRFSSRREGPSDDTRTVYDVRLARHGGRELRLVKFTKRDPISYLQRTIEEHVSQRQSEAAP